MNSETITYITNTHYRKLVKYFKKVTLGYDDELYSSSGLRIKNCGLSYAGSILKRLVGIN